MSQQQTTPSSPGDLERRLQRLEDLQAIQQLFIDYGRLLDAGDFKAYGELFTETGELLLGPMGRATGPAAIEELMSRTLAGQRGDSYHLVTSPVISLEGDTAAATVMWTVVGRRPDGTPHVTMLGRHEDVLAREGGRWRFARRRGLIDLPARLPASAGAAIRTDEPVVGT